MAAGARVGQAGAVVVAMLVTVVAEIVDLAPTLLSPPLNTLTLCPCEARVLSWCLWAILATWWQSAVAR